MVMAKSDKTQKAMSEHAQTTYTTFSVAPEPSQSLKTTFSPSNETQVNKLSHAIFCVKNFIFKIIVPVVLLSTLIFILHLPTNKPSFYRNRKPPNFGNTIANHNDGFSDDKVAGTKLV